MRRQALASFGFPALSAAFIALLAGLTLTLPAPARAYLYWNGGDDVTRANLNGTGVDTSFIPDILGSTQGVGVTNQYVYFGGAGGTIGRANLNGSSVNRDFISIPQPVPEDPSAAGEEDASSLAISTTHIYWADSDYSGISRASVDGSGIEMGFIKTEAVVLGLALGEGHIYWASEHGIGRANLDGSDVEPDFIPLQSTGVNGIAVADGYIYWSTRFSGAIGRANEGGQRVDPHFVAGLGYVASLCVGGGYLYWQAEVRSAPTRPSWIGRADLNGTDIQKNLINLTKTDSGKLAADALGPGGATPAKRAKLHHKQRR
jgi:hypothetical protein